LPSVISVRTNPPRWYFFYKVVDGKQRITALLGFVRDEFPVSEDYPNEALRGKLFSQFDDGLKLTVWRYNFTVEFVEQENEAIINDIFNRINKNVARLTPQELRHAKFYGIFSQAAERLTEFAESKLPAGFPRIASQSKRQMKDVENVANLLLFCELGERSISQIDLDNAYSQREDEWEREAEIGDIFSRSIDYLHSVTLPPDGEFITDSRLRNQADFYSLFAAITELFREGRLPDPIPARGKLHGWIDDLKAVEDTDNGLEADREYLKAARSASNDPTPRRIRINRIKSILTD
jgi:hypothetical protein